MVKRLDEDFDWRYGPLLEAMRRLMGVLEARFQPLEEKQADFDAAINDLTNLGINRMNEVLLPVLQDFIELADTGFLIADSTYSVRLDVGVFKTWVVDEGAKRRQFTPTHFLVIFNKENLDDWAICELASYDNTNGELVAKVLSIGSVTDIGPHTQWEISGTAGSLIAQQQLYEDSAANVAGIDADRVAAETARNEAQAAAAETDTARDEVIAALAAFEGGGVASVNGRGGLVVLTKADVGLTNVDNTSDLAKPKPTVLANVDNTSDLNKPVSNATQVALNSLTSAYQSADTTLQNAINLKHNISDKATAVDLLAGTDDTKYITSKAVFDSCAPVVLADAATISAPNMAAGVYFTVTIAAVGRTLPNPTNIKVGRSFYLKVKQDGTGNRTITTWGSNYDFGQSTAPTLSTAANAEDLLSFFASAATKIVYLGIRKDIG